MLRLVADIEGDGFLEEATVIHCIITKNIDTGLVQRFYGDTTVHGHHGSIQCGIDYLFSADVVIGHNFVGYDLPVIKKLYLQEYTGQLFDTLVMSRTMNPDRRLPQGCPTSIKNPVTGKKDRIGPHSLAAWGYKVGRGKPAHYDWKVFSEAMLHRCEEDVEINHLTLNALMNEIGLTEMPAYQDLPNYVRVEQTVAVRMQTQMETGWLVDVPLLHKHIDTLQTMVNDLQAELDDRLPYIAKPLESNIKKEEDIKKYLIRNLGLADDVVLTPETKANGIRRWVTKPYLASGKLNANVIKYWRLDLSIEQCDRENDPSASWSIGGAYCRVEMRKIKLSSDAEVKDFLLTQGWQPDEWNFSKITKAVTSPKFTESSLDSIRGDTGRLIAKHMKASQRLSTMLGWVKHIGDDNRLHGIVNPQSCPTVRMTHKILVNVPSVEKKSFFAEEMREIFIAPAGYVLVSADAVSCQARMLCEYMGDDEFTEVVVNGKKEDGTDIHSYNMRMAGLPTRGHAKNFYYGFIFGAGPTKVGRLIGGGMNAGKKIIAKYLASIPKLSALRKGLEKEWRLKGYLIGLDGRKIYIQTKKDLLCYMLQSAEAMVMKIAICLVNHWIEQEKLDAKMVCVMHDEFTFEVLTAHAERVKFLAEESIRQAGQILGLTVPSDGEGIIGNNWKTVH